MLLLFPGKGVDNAQLQHIGFFRNFPDRLHKGEKWKAHGNIDPIKMIFLLISTFHS